MYCNVTEEDMQLLVTIHHGSGKICKRAVPTPSVKTSGKASQLSGFSHSSMA